MIASRPLGMTFHVSGIAPTQYSRTAAPAVAGTASAMRATSAPSAMRKRCDIPRRYLTVSLPCIQGWIAQRKDSVVPALALTLTFADFFGCRTMESPAWSMPLAPTSRTGCFGGASLSGFEPCFLPIDSQTLHEKMASGVLGSCELFTTENECGAGSPAVLIVSVPPEAIVRFGTTQCDVSLTYSLTLTSAPALAVSVTELGAA